MALRCIMGNKRQWIPFLEDTGNDCRKLIKWMTDRIDYGVFVLEWSYTWVGQHRFCAMLMRIHSVADKRHHCNDHLFDRSVNPERAFISARLSGILWRWYELRPQKRWKLIVWGKNVPTPIWLEQISNIPNLWAVKSRGDRYLMVSLD